MKLANTDLRNIFFMSAVKTGYGDAEGNISEHIGDEAAKIFMRDLSNLKEQVMLGKKI